MQGIGSMSAAAKALMQMSPGFKCCRKRSRIMFSLMLQEVWTCQ